MSTSASAIKVLVIICIILFAITFMAPGLHDRMFESFALYFPKHPHFRIWQFITNIFMHGGFAHIFFNMYALWAFGSPLEQIWGRNRFLLFFFLSGIGAAVIYTMVNLYKFNNLHNEFIAAGLSSEDINSILERGRNSLQAIGSISAEKVTDFWALFHIPVVGASGAIYGVLVAFGILFQMQSSS